MKNNWPTRVITIISLRQNSVFFCSKNFPPWHPTETLLAKLRDDIQKSMKVSEIPLTVFTDYSKAFDTIVCSVWNKKMHTLNFSKRFLYCIFSYLTGRCHFVQIDSNICNTLCTNFGVPQGSIFGPAFFNLCVTDMKIY